MTLSIDDFIEAREISQTDSGMTDLLEKIEIYLILKRADETVEQTRKRKTRSLHREMTLTP